MDQPPVSLNSTSTLVMVRPSSFGSNPETLSDNAFQSSSTTQTNQKIKIQSVCQFDNYVQQLREHGITVLVVEDTKEPEKPDAVFPNNWFTTHRDGRVVLYPMKPVSRRAERGNPVLKTLKENGYGITQVIDYSGYEEKKLENGKTGIFLQGTGSMVLDHQNRIAYACKSQRTNQQLFHKVCTQVFKYIPIYFTAIDQNNTYYYHTNVVMSVCSDFVIVCLEVIQDSGERKKVEDVIRESGVGMEGRKKELIDITREQVGNFCGNVLQVYNPSKKEKILTMGETAYKAFTQQQLTTIQKYCKILKVELKCIQNYGGGGSRCMMAQIFLPKNQ